MTLLAELLPAVRWWHVAVAVTVYYVTRTIYRLTLHPLAKFPGPKLAAITRLYEAYYDVVQEGQYTFKIGELHKQYGWFLFDSYVTSGVSCRCAPMWPRKRQKK